MGFRQNGTFASKKEADDEFVVVLDEDLRNAADPEPEAGEGASQAGGQAGGQDEHQARQRRLSAQARGLLGPSGKVPPGRGCRFRKKTPGGHHHPNQ